MESKDLDFGFIILCPDRNIGGLRNTLGSISYHSYGRDSICVVGSDANTADVKEMKEHCPTYKGKDSITSLINTGMKRLKNEWGFIVFSGSRIMIYTERRMCAFVNSDKDIIYPVFRSGYNLITLDEKKKRRRDKDPIPAPKTGFVESSANGILINRKTFKEVGDMPDGKMIKEDLNEFELAKLLWAVDAMEKDCIFKGIVGLKII